jgi:DNA invertase Pin-like site-specific DNA recombinase
MKKVYGYIRVSTAKQGEGVSLSVQQEAITAYAAKYNLEIVRWFEEKETAAKQGRPLFMAMMKLLKAQKADGVIIHKIDRSARNLKDWADLGNLIDQGVEVHFAHESLDLKARGGRLSADIQAVIAADYIRNLRQEAIKGIYGRLNQGILPLPAPVGYVNNGKGKVKTIDPIQGALVRKAFELYSTKRYTLKTLVAHMESLGLRNTKGKSVNLNSLSLILNNPYYMGIIRVKGNLFNGSHEPLVSPKLFKQVQAILRGNTNQKINKHNFKLRKMLSCKGCGYSLIGELQKGHTYYRCHTKGCVTKGIREITIDNLLLKVYEATQLLPVESTELDSLLASTEQNWVKTQEELLTSLSLQCGQIRQKIERLTDCYVDEGLEKDVFLNRKEMLLTELKGKESTKNDLHRGKEKIFQKVKNFLEFSKSLKKSYENGNSDEQRQLAQITTSNLVIEGKKLMISMASPFLELAERHFLTSSAPQRCASRKENTTFCYFEQNTSPIIGEPLSKEQLESLFNLIIETAQNLPDINDMEYDV